MHIRVGDVVFLIIRDRFGPMIEKVVHVLKIQGTSTLTEIRKKTELPLDKVKEALCILIKYRLVSFEPHERYTNVAEYTLCAGNIILMLRYPRYMILIKKKFGDQSEMIIEELLQNGYLTAQNIILNVAERLKCDKSELCHIRDKFCSLVVAKYIRKLPKVINQAEELHVPIFENSEEEAFSIPTIDLKLLTQVYVKKIEKKELPEDDYWIVNFDRYHQDMRDQCIVDAFVNRIDESAGVFVGLLLQRMYIRTEPWADSSDPVPLSEIKHILTGKMINPNLVTFFDQYVNVIEQDNYNIVVRSGEANGGSFQIHLKKAFAALAWELVEKVILQKFDSKAMRIFRLVKEKELIDPEQLQQLVMIPSKEAKRISYQLVQEGFLKIRELRKPSSNSGPVKSVALFYIDLHIVVENLYHLSFKTLRNIMIRRNHLYDTNKRLLEKKERCDMIVMMMKTQGATAEQISEFEENISPPEREIINNVERQMKKLNLAEFEMDTTIFIIEMYLKYHLNRLIY